MYMNMIKSTVSVDITERIRNKKLIIVLGLTAFVTILCFPNRSQNYATMMVYGYTGYYTSEWMGYTSAVVSAVFLSLFGYYLINGSIERDKQTRVDQLISNSRMGDTTYLLGKLFANVCTLSIVGTVVMVVSIIIQLARDESSKFNIQYYIVPFLLVTIPVFVLISSIAIFIETLPNVSVSGSNVLYFFLWSIILPMSFLVGFDLFGFIEMEQSIIHQTGDPLNDGTSMIGSIEGDVKYFYWTPYKFSTSILISKALILAIAVVFLILANMIYSANRFKSIKSKNNEDDKIVVVERTNEPYKRMGTELRFGMLGMFDILVMELRMVKRDVSRKVIAFYLLTILVILEGNPLDGLKILWLYPIVWWNKVGIRGNLNNANALLFSNPYPIKRQFPAEWLSGVTISFVTGGVPLLMLIGTEHFLSVLIAVFFIPTLALITNVISNSSTPFMLIYLLLWYLGPMNGITIFDYYGAFSATVDGGIHLFYLLATILMLPIAFLLKSRQSST